jgi:hypothetical protein
LDRVRQLFEDVHTGLGSCTPGEVLDEPEAPVRQFVRTARGVPRVDCESILALCVAKVERLLHLLTDKPPTRDAAAGIPSGNASAALDKDETRLAAHDAVVGSATHEHGKSIEVPHESSVVGLKARATLRRAAHTEEREKRTTRQR